LEQRWKGWGGKVMILILLGFVGTDFIMTRSLSVSDAATHVAHNPLYKARQSWVTDSRDAVVSMLPEYWQQRIGPYWTEQLLLSVILSVIAFALYFYLIQTLSRGFVGVAVSVVAVYVFLTTIVVASGLLYLLKNQEIILAWEQELRPEIG